MNYDDILEELGELGTWQILNMLLLWLPSTACGIFVLTYSFTGNFDAFQFSSSYARLKAKLENISKSMFHCCSLIYILMLVPRFQVVLIFMFRYHDENINNQQS